MKTGISVRELRADNEKWSRLIQRQGFQKNREFLGHHNTEQTTEGSCRYVMCS